VTDFRDLGLSEATIRSLTEMGFEEPTPVQARAIPCLLEGRDIIAQALTGTGKTAAYGVPIAERVDPKRPVPQAVVLTPTRELAIQVTDHLSKIGRQGRLSVIPIYGGQPIGRQLATLRRGVQVIVATPGRLLDHLRRGSVDLGEVRLLVLDEADQMLEMGFIEDVEYVLDRLPAERVTALFSATMPKPIVELAQRYLREPEMLRLSRPQKLTVPEIDQVYYLVPFVRKMDALCRVLDARQPERTIVFCATRRMVDEVVEGLGSRGYLAEGLHGEVSQAMRERVLRAFRAGQTEVLVATDVAARGLDVPEVSHVINFDIPPDPEYYVHRIGRTGRYGRRGEAITFVNPREMRVLRIIERVTGAHIRREEVPTVAEVEEREASILGERLLSSLAKGDWGKYRPLIEELADDHDLIDVAAAALSLAASAAGTNRRPRAGGTGAAPRTERRATTEPERPAERRRPRPPRDGAIEDAPGPRGDTEDGRDRRQERSQQERPPQERPPREREPRPTAPPPKPRRQYVSFGKSDRRRQPPPPQRGRSGRKPPRDR
jgi:ATP-dependent RNA helicase DeaD